MLIPCELKRIAKKMHQDVDLIFRSEDELLDYLAGDCKEEEKISAINFINGILQSDLSPKELAEVWVEAGADWRIEQEDARPFFEKLRDRLVGGE